MKVDFMVIGARKSGTTSLVHQLRQHPQICFCRKKEPEYFSSNIDWQSNIDNYHKLYNPINGQLCGEASTSYTDFPNFKHTSINLYDYNPELKLIYIMRHPVERIVSNYKYRVVRKKTTNPPDIDCFKYPSYLNLSRYKMQLEPYLNLFPRENILLLVFEEFVFNNVNALDEISNFLNIYPDGFQNIDKTPKNVSTSNKYIKKFPASNLIDYMMKKSSYRFRKIIKKYLYHGLNEDIVFSPALKHKLWKELENDVGFIEQLLGRNIDFWWKEYSN